jgi:hypothetical protein
MFRAFGSDRFTVDLDPVVEQVQQQSHHLAEGQRADRKVEAAQAQGGQPQHDAGEPGSGRGRGNRQRQRQ